MKENEALVAAVAELTNQVARVANATEILVINTLTMEAKVLQLPCSCCGCRLIHADMLACPACRTEVRK